LVLGKEELKMKKQVLIGIVVGVVLVHAALFLLLSGTGKSNDVAVEETPVVEAPKASGAGVQNPQAGDPASDLAPALPQGVQTPAAADASAPAALPSWAPFNDSYYHAARVTLPGNIGKLAAQCSAGIALDVDTRIAYWAKDPYTARPIASITKMMTALLAVERMRKSNGGITPDTMIQVTRQSALIGGRQVWLDPKESFTFTELLKCILVHSANDCAYLMGEFMGNGNISSFVADMNKRAAELGCKRFVFYNTHGLTEETGNGRKDNLAAPVELAYLASLLLDVPEIMRWTGIKTEWLRENDEAYKKRNKGQATMLSSANSLLGNCPGVNGMKTGFTNNAGSCIVITCERNGRRVAVVLLGCRDRKVRDQLGRSLLDFVYSQKG